MSSRRQLSEAHPERPCQDIIGGGEQSAEGDLATGRPNDYGVSASICSIGNLVDILFEVISALLNGTLECSLDNASRTNFFTI